MAHVGKLIKVGPKVEPIGKRVGAPDSAKNLDADPGDDVAPPKVAPVASQRDVKNLERGPRHGIMSEPGSIKASYDWKLY